MRSATRDLVLDLKELLKSLVLPSDGPPKPPPKERYRQITVEEAWARILHS